MTEASPVLAVLGPTNTGKTHRAVERMLEHDTGMIGLPLRLLAREIYDRLTVRVGEARVALVTGEEKRVPRHPDYWVCTVEAMPIEREVDFLAVDEVQLAAHDQRGHVFTDRLLHARGRRETWFMGSDTMRPIVASLLPAAKIVQHPRLSRLASAGASPLARLPPRSAVVAFSTPQVYEIAERLRALRGGAAVVLGALSPRTRNAQVALFQSGEVDYLVATDAIGMGLNLDVGHVAFAALRKFDGREARDLDAAELAQIAGRAGRYLQDGTFGTLTPLALAPPVVHAIETHRFPAVRRVRWRAHDLDFTSLDALLDSLRAPPPARATKLWMANDADDHAALRRLAQSPGVRARARDEEAIRLLWDVCRIPDYRKLLFEVHTGLLAEIFAQLVGDRARLDPDWLARHVDELDDPRGDVDTFVARLAAIRTWTYVANQTRWIDDAPHWQARTRAVEDRLGDALHDALVQRFVERTSRKRRVARARARAPRDRRPDADDADLAPRAGHPFARLAALRATLPASPDAFEAPDPDDARDRFEHLVAAPHDRFTLDARGRILDGEMPLAHLVRGASLLLPDVRLLDLDGLGPGARVRLHRRLVAFARDLVTDLLAPLRSADARSLSAAARGLLYQVEQGLGTATTAAAEVQIANLAPADRDALPRLGLHLGARVAYVPSLSKPAAVARRFVLTRIGDPTAARLPEPRAGAVSLPLVRGVAPRAYLAIGFVPAGPRALRADLVERIHAAVTSDDPSSSARAASWVGCKAAEARAVVDAVARSSPAAPTASPADR